VRGKVTVGVRGSRVVVFFPDGTQLSKPIPEGMTGEQAIQDTLKLLEFFPQDQNWATTTQHASS
jgi:hypothetical protein